MKSSKMFKTVFFDTLRKFLPVSSAYWGIMIIFYPCLELLFRFTNYMEYLNNVNASLMTESDLAILSEWIQIIVVGASSVIFSAIIAFIAFSYLHNKRQMDFVASLPVTRRIQFFGRLTAVITVVIVPLVVCSILGSLAVGFAGFGTTMMLTLMISLATIGNITFIGFLAICSGTVAQTCASYLLINIVYPILMLIVGLYPSAVFPGIEKSFLNAVVVTLLSPIFAPFAGFGNSLNLEEQAMVEVPMLKFGGTTAFYCIWWGVFAIGFMVLSYVLIKKRRTETAQTGYAFRIPIYVIRFFATLTVGCIGGGLLSSIFSFASSLGGVYAVALFIVTFVIGFVVATVVSDLVIHLIYNGGMSGYLKKLISVAIVIAIGLSVFLGISRDVTGVVTYIPNADNVESISYNISEDLFTEDNNGWKITITDGKEIAKALEIQKKLVEDIDDKRNGWYVPTNDFEHYIDASDEKIKTVYDYITNYDLMYNVTVDIKLKNGITVNRKYSYNDSSTEILYNELIPLLDIDYIASTNKKKISCADIYLNIDGEFKNSCISVYDLENEDKSDEIAQGLFEAVKKDVEKVGYIKTPQKDDCGIIEFYTSEYYDVILPNVLIDSSYENTISYIKNVVLKEYKAEDYPQYFYD